MVTFCDLRNQDLLIRMICKTGSPIFCFAYKGIKKEEYLNTKNSSKQINNDDFVSKNKLKPINLFNGHADFYHIHYYI